MDPATYTYSSIEENGLPSGDQIKPTDSIAKIVDGIAQAMLDDMKEKGDMVLRCNRLGSAGIFYNYTNLDDENPLFDFTAQISIDELVNEVIQNLPESYEDETADEMTRIIVSLEAGLEKLRIARDALK